MVKLISVAHLLKKLTIGINFGALSEFIFLLVHGPLCIDESEQGSLHVPHTM